MAVLLSPVGGVAAQFFTNAGVPLSGGKIYTYAAGTSTPQATYTTGAGNIQHSNPIVLDAAGRVPTGEIWLTDGLSYKFVLKDANDVLIATYDNIVGINSNFVNFVNQQEIQTATANQTVFTLTTMEYQPGTGNLSVFVDGVNQYGPGAQYAYTETDSNTVTFVSGLHVGASVKFTTTEIQNSGIGDASQITYTAPYAGAVTTNVENQLAQILTRNDFNSDASFNSAKQGVTSIDAANRLRSTYLIAGDEELTAPATRDAIVVGRTVEGATDCHGFADRTILDNVTDYGGYGTFDATTEVHGSHVQNHVFSFQDRTRYYGSGTLENQAGLYSRPEHHGTGTIEFRRGVHVYDIYVTNGSAVVNEQAGIYLEDLQNSFNNAGIVIKQSTGYALYAENNGKTYLYGKVGIGTIPSASRHFTIKTPGTTGQAFIDTTNGGAYLGSEGNCALGFITNDALRLEIADSTTSYTVRPGSDNSQPLGDVTHRWSAVYAGNGTIQTSDGNEKAEIRDLEAAEKAVGVKLKSIIKAYKFKDAIEKKGSDARIHVGVIAQDVKAAFESEGLDASRYGVFCSDTWTDEDGQEKTRLGVRYDELFAFIIAGM